MHKMLNPNQVAETSLHPKFNKHQSLGRTSYGGGAARLSYGGGFMGPNSSRSNSDERKDVQGGAGAQSPFTQDSRNLKGRNQMESRRS